MIEFSITHETNAACSWHRGTRVDDVYAVRRVSESHNVLPWPAALFQGMELGHPLANIHPTNHLRFNCRCRTREHSLATAKKALKGVED